MDSLRFKDKVAIVTGGCKGIGRGIVDVLGDNGGKIAVFDIDDATGKTLCDIKTPGEIYFVHCDTSNEEEIKTSISAVVNHFGRIDVLINNAGWHPPEKTIDEFTSTEFRKLIDLNLVGYFLTCKYSLPEIRKNKGNIINISSAAGPLGQPGAITYCATKGGITSMTRCLSIDEGTHGVRVNTISPGPIYTPLFEDWVNSVEDKSLIENSKCLTQLGRFGEPREIGEACLYLATAATYTTGIDMHVSGGYEIGQGYKNLITNN